MQGEERMSNLAILSIEKQLLETIRDQDNFYECVIQKFSKKLKELSLCTKCE